MSTDSRTSKERPCPHGHNLRRKCGTCDREDDKAEIERLTRELVEAKRLLTEVRQWHSDKNSPDYNECDTAPCHWCEQASNLGSPLEPAAVGLLREWLLATNDFNVDAWVRKVRDLVEDGTAPPPGDVETGNERILAAALAAIADGPPAGMDSEAASWAKWMAQQALTETKSAPRSCAACGLDAKDACPHCDTATCGECQCCEHAHEKSSKPDIVAVDHEGKPVYALPPETGGSPR